ncbi:MAG: histidine kinase dimerization/phosphoacceptor domain -containing protein, partial [Tepidisphaeraceae bacterium]
PGEMLAAAVTGVYAEQIAGRRFRSSGTNADRVMASRCMLVVEDGPNDPTLHPYFRKVMNAGSVIYLPLFRSDSAPLGVLVLVRHAPGLFTRDQLEMAQLFATRAAAAVENARLHGQARRDAETKAMLLRELNHRVKNVLSGIVGLLSMNTPPELTVAAREWLARVTERIGTIARTHELFVGGPGHERVELGELIQRTLQSLSIDKPAGVSIRTEVDGVRATLRSERAVSLAMVIHELCYNAVVHGSGEEGVVTVRLAWADAPNRVAVSVLDEGSETASAPAELERNPVGDANRFRSATGSGLGLVNGLVGRELQGRFALSSRSGGGIAAVVEFPLLGDESVQPGQGDV